MNTSTRLSLLLAVSLAACGAEPPVARRSQPIIGGTADPGDPAVMLLVSYDGNVMDECTAVLVAPTVMLTAAHCIDPATHKNYSFGVFPGADGSMVKVNQLLPVAELHPHPQYNPNNSDNDIGVVILSAALATPPIPINRTPLDAGFMGRAARVVGYGRTDFNVVNSAGTRRQIATLVVSYDAATVEVGDMTRHTCLGDSGAPALAMVNGVEQMIGTDSHAPFGCTSASIFMRVDHYFDFLSPWLPPPPDMASSPDMTSPPDMTALPDFATPVDLAAPPEMKMGGCHVAGRGQDTSPIAAVIVLLALGAALRRARTSKRSSSP